MQALFNQILVAPKNSNHPPNNLHPENNENDQKMDTDRKPENISINQTTYNSMQPPAGTPGCQTPLDSTGANLIASLFKTKLAAKTLKFTEVNIRFYWGQFLKAFIIHFVYFIFLGPLSLIFFIPIYGKDLMYNMQFMGLGFGLVSQLIIWLANAAFLIITIVYPYQLNIELAVLILFACILRIAVICIRYGYTSPEIMSVYENVNLKIANKLSKEIALSGWYGIKPDDALDEIKLAMWKLNIPSEEFIFVFKDKMPNVLYERLTNENYYNENEYSLEKDTQINFWFSENHSKTDPIPPELEKLVTRKRQKEEVFKGESLAREILLMSKDKAQMRTLPFIIAFMHVFLPFITGAFENEIWGEHWSIIAIRVINILQSFLLNVLNILVLQIACTDSIRRNVLLDYCGKLLDIKKNKSEYFPRISLLGSPVSFLNWMKLRCVLMETGKKYQVRTNVYNSLYLVMYCLLFTVIVLYYFDVLGIHLSVQFLTICWFDLTLFFTLLLYNFYLGIEANEQYGNHSDILHSQKEFLSYAKTILEYKNSEFQKHVPYSHNRELLKFIETNEKDECLKILDILISDIDLVNERLKIEENI